LWVVSCLYMAFISPEEIIKNLSLDVGMQVADFGAGSGAYSILAGKQVGASGRVYAIDVNKELLAKIKKDAADQKIFNVEIIWGDVETPGGTKLKDKLIDRVIISNILFQVEDKEGVAKEAARILKPNGLVLVIDWSGSYGGLGPKESDVLSKETAQRFFLNNSFAPARDLPAGDYHFGFIMRRL